MKEFSFIIKNKKYYSMKRAKYFNGFIKTLFGDWDGIIDPPIVYLSSKLDMYDVLVLTHSFSSRSEAKRQWKHGKEIPLGVNEFKVGNKFLGKHIVIWNPK